MATLVVEDGTGLANANSFISQSYFEIYSSERGRDLSPYSDENKITALIRASEYLSESFNWKGIRKKGRNYEDGTEFQALAWPRYGVTDDDGFYVPDDEIPREVQWATAEAAFYEIEDPSALRPAYIAHNRARMIKAGSVAITYDTSTTSQNIYGTRPVLLSVIDLISKFLKSGAGSGSGGASSGLTGRALRG